jgi:circadian clock protein KaiB
MTHTPPASARLDDYWELRLYVAGNSIKAVTASSNLRAICDFHLAGRYELEIIDVLETPEIAERDRIMALPTLVRRHPLPVRKIIGDLSDEDRVITALDIFRAAQGRNSQE